MDKQDVMLRTGIRAVLYSRNKDRVGVETHTRDSTGIVLEGQGDGVRSTI